MEKEPTGWLHELGLALAYHTLGRRLEADAALNRLATQYPNDAAYQITQGYAHRREVDQPFEWLARAYMLPDPGLQWFKTDLKLKSLRKDPRRTQMLKRLNLTD
jgi:hypothetical protein